MTKVQQEDPELMKVQHDGHEIVTEHRQQKMNHQRCPCMLQVALWSAVRSFPFPQRMVYRIWWATASMEVAVLSFSKWMKNAVAAGSDYGGHHFQRSSWDRDHQPKCWTSEQGAGAVIVVDKELRPGELEWLLLALRVRMGGCATSGVRLAPGRTISYAGPWHGFPIIIPNPKCEVRDRVYCPDAGTGNVPTDDGYCISAQCKRLEATCKPPRHSGQPHQCSQLIPDAPRPSWS